MGQLLPRASTEKLFVVTSRSEVYRAALGETPAPVWTDREVLAADPGLRLVKGFIAHVLPGTHKNYDADDLLAWLMPFGVDFAPAFLAADAEVARSTEFIMSADASSECALAWPDPPYDKVWAQVLALDAAVDKVLLASSEERRQAWQGVLDFAQDLAVQERTVRGSRRATLPRAMCVRAAGKTGRRLRPLPITSIRSLPPRR